MDKILNIIFSGYFCFGLLTGFIILPLLICLLGLFIMFCIDVVDYSNNKKEFKEWLKHKYSEEVKD